MLIELLRRTAGEVPEQPVIIAAGREVGYAECVEASEALARGLADRELARFGTWLDDPADVLVALNGSSAIGSEACIYSRELDAAAVARTAATFEHPAVLTNREAELDLAGAVRIDEIASDEGALGPVPEHAPVLILTTGTTGHQKGARHDWSRLIEAVRNPDPEPGARWLLAYNLNQFAGVQVLLHVLTSGATMVAPASRRPRDVIEAIRTHRVTHVSATPTFWRLLVGNLDPEEAAELPLRQITLGGEAVPGPLIERLGELFPGANISQIYGATEFGTAVSVRDGQPGLPLSVLEREDGADVQLRIVDGEIHMRSRVGMLGYHDDKEADAGWRPTGDLVEIRGDRIHFVGRKTEIINVGGAKVHPLPIEEAASTVVGVALVAAYGRPNPVTGQIVALDVVAADSADDLEALEAKIRAACAAAIPPAGRPRSIRFVEELEIRGSKLARLGARDEAQA